MTRLLLILAVPACLIHLAGQVFFRGGTAQAAQEAPPPARPAPPEPLPDIGPLRDASGRASGPAPGTVLAYQPATDRDPTLSEPERETLARALARRYAAARASARLPLEGRLEVQAVMGIGRTFSAIVDDKPVRVGSVVSGARVVRIRLDRVEFQREGRKIIRMFR